MFINNFPRVNYIGNKEKISNWICDQFPKDVKTVFDAFSGGTSLSYEAKRRGYKVISNDILKINYFIAKALIENKSITLSKKDLQTIFSGKPFCGFMFRNFSKVYYYPLECKELDLYKKNIKKIKNNYKRYLAFTILRRAMIRKMPYSRFNILWKKIIQLRDENFSYKHYKRKRAYHNENFEFHFKENLEEYNKAIFDNKKKNIALNLDVYKAIEKVDADLIYLDPPYSGTMNDYYSFYGLLDKFILSKKIKRISNNFIDKNRIIKDFHRLFSKISKYKYCFLSYNNQSFPDKTIITSILKKYSKKLKIFKRKHTYKITGQKNKKINEEYLFFIKN